MGAQGAAGILPAFEDSPAARAAALAALRASRVTVVVCCSAEGPAARVFEADGIAYADALLSDGRPELMAACVPAFFALLGRALPLVRAAHAAGNAALVHCNSGMHRSASVAMGLMMLLQARRGTSGLARVFAEAVGKRQVMRPTFWPVLESDEFAEMVICEEKAVLSAMTPGGGSHPAAPGVEGGGEGGGGAPAPPPPFQPNRVCPLWSERAGAPVGPFWAPQLREFEARGGMIQQGPTCVSNSLALLTLGAARPEAFQGGAINTQDPVTWSRALLPFGMKLCYCSVDARRLSWYVPELARLHDVFTVSYYTGDHAADPGADGWVCGSHIVVVAGDKVYDSCNEGSPILLTGAHFREHYGPRFVKRIFRVVPAAFPHEL